MKSRNRWRVKRLDMEPEKGVWVTLETGGHEVRLLASQFAVGEPGAKAAALARFAAKSGMGPVQQVYRFIKRLPSDWRGLLPLPLLPAPKLDPEILGVPALFLPEEAQRRFCV